MSKTTTVRVRAIEDLRRRVEDAPPCEVEEVSRAKAGRMLIPEIRALRAKGYSLPAIAEMFTESGVPVTASSLASYLKEARKASRSKRGGAKASSAPATDLPRSRQGSRPAS